MDIKTIQNSLKGLFYSLGGNSGNVKNTDDVNAILDEMTALGIGKQIQDAAQSGGTTVVANPTLAGTEASLTGLQVGDTKYAVGGSSGGGGVLVVDVTKEERILTCGKTAGEIYEACPTVFFSVPDSGGFEVKVIGYYEQTADGYTFEAGNYVFEAETSADYPQFDMDK